MKWTIHNDGDRAFYDCSSCASRGEGSVCSYQTCCGSDKNALLIIAAHTNGRCPRCGEEPEGPPKRSGLNASSQM